MAGSRCNEQQVVGRRDVDTPAETAKASPRGARSSREVVAGCGKKEQGRGGRVRGNGAERKHGTPKVGEQRSQTEDHGRRENGTGRKRGSEWRSGPRTNGREEEQKGGRSRKER